MSSDPGEQQPAPKPDAAHLDEDAEALEDPVHAGDARHQREAHHETESGESPEG